MDYAQLAREMKEAITELDKLPDDKEWTMEELEALDDCRMNARWLADLAEETIKIFEGRQP